jgi:hypothetical protein
MPEDFVMIKRLIIKTTSPGVRRGLISTRDKMLDYHARWRTLQGWTGSLPDYVIVGTQKGGTTELYEQLIQHPQVKSSFAKEVHFFDANYDKGMGWYRAFFPQQATAQPNGSITGEASPCYLFHPTAARRAHASIPHAKIIVLLRDPVHRAYSHYHHEVRLGHETLSFEEAIACEPERLRGEKERMLADDRYYSEPYMHHSYLARGVYVDQVKAWFAHFPPEQVLVLQSEDFFADMEYVMRQVYAFLGIAYMPSAKLKKHKTFPYRKMDEGMQRYLREYFAPFNRQLYAYLGREFTWE